jgi:hypothetical protein
MFLAGAAFSTLVSQNVSLGPYILIHQARLSYTAVAQNDNLHGAFDQLPHIPSGLMTCHDTFKRIFFLEDMMECSLAADACNRGFGGYRAKGLLRSKTVRCVL